MKIDIKYNTCVWWLLTDSLEHVCISPIEERKKAKDRKLFTFKYMKGRRRASVCVVYVCIGIGGLSHSQFSVVGKRVIFNKLVWWFKLISDLGNRAKSIVLTYVWLWMSEPCMATFSTVHVRPHLWFKCPYLSMSITECRRFIVIWSSMIYILLFYSYKRRLTQDYRWCG